MVYEGESEAGQLVQASREVIACSGKARFNGGGGCLCLLLRLQSCSEDTCTIDPASACGTGQQCS